MQGNPFRWLLALVFSTGLAGLTFYYVSSTGSFGMFMNGDLSLNHSQLANNCQKCHEPWLGVGNKACLSCHDGYQHQAAKEAVEDKNLEKPCLSCHLEHQGKQHSAAIIEDHACQQCHAWKEHPKAKAKVLAPSTAGDIKFSHQKHIAKGSFNLEACEMCHVKSDRADFFIKPTFANSCAACHTVEIHSPLAKDLMTCLKCHADDAYVPPISREHFLTKTRLSHDRHGKFTCADCHDMGVAPPPPGAKEKQEAANAANDEHEKSYDSIRITPDAQKCQSCHEGLVSGDCRTCHKFHPLLQKKLADRGDG